AVRHSAWRRSSTETLPSGVALFDVHHLRLAQGEAPEPRPEHVAAWDRVWETEVRANPALFDGPVVACAELRWEESHRLFLRLGFGDVPPRCAAFPALRRCRPCW
ncbi:NUDIX hydrolase, partial [Streptomyces sp. NPDC059233]